MRILHLLGLPDEARESRVATTQAIDDVTPPHQRMQNSVYSMSIVVAKIAKIAMPRGKPRREACLNYLVAQGVSDATRLPRGRSVRGGN
jgi:hypothetical protein